MVQIMLKLYGDLEMSQHLGVLDDPIAHLCASVSPRLTKAQRLVWALLVSLESVEDTEDGL